MGTECPYLLLENCPGRLWKGDKASRQGWAFSQVPGDIFPKQPHAGSAPFTALRLRVCTGWQFKAMRKGSGSTHLLRAGTFLPAHFPPTGWSQNTHPSTTPSRKTGALLVHATTGPVSNRLRSPAKEHITEQRLNACGSHRTPAKVLLPRAICNSCRHTAAPVAPPSKPQHTTKRTHTSGVLQRICKLTTAWRRQLGRE